MTTARYRIVDDAHVYFMTYSIVQWLPVFVSDNAVVVRSPDRPTVPTAGLPFTLTVGLN